LRLGDLVAVVAGAGIGGGLRYAVGLWLAQRWGASFPWHTFFINISGAFLLGIVMALSTQRGLIAPEWRLFLGVGVLGGYTTFSTLSYESVALLERGLVFGGVINMFGSAIVGLIAVAAGLYVGRIL
jgi:fluoride exporter